MKGVVVVDTSMFFYDNNNKTPGVSSKRKVATLTDQTQEINGALGVGMPIMAAKKL